MFQSPEGDSLFFYVRQSMSVLASTGSFQSPEGDSLFFYQANVSAIVPGRVKVFAFQSPEGDSLFFYSQLVAFRLRRSARVSVPRRGFIVFLPRRYCQEGA